MQDVVAERAVLAGIIRYGASAYYDVADILNENSFTLDSNAILYKIVKNILEADDKTKIDIPTIYSTAKNLGLYEIYQDKTENQHLQAILSLPVANENVRKFGAKVAKLAVGRLLTNQLETARDTLETITGDETYAHILGIAEDAIFNFGSLLNDNDGPQLLGNNLRERLKYREENPVEQIGISTGYRRFDRSIGGGLRKGTVNVIGARIKVGKSLLGDNIGTHISANIGLPVFNLDTEMLQEDHQNRTTAMISEVPIDDIETGKFGKNQNKRQKIYEAVNKIEKMRYFHQCIGGMPFEEQLAVMRRWLVKEVGLNADNTAKPCVFIYDYIKLMAADTITKNIQEYQALGFMMTGLHNFALRYKVPIIAFVQLNRDGITKESTDAASGSDRILWLCSNFSIYKPKSDEEIASDGPEYGTRKLVPLVARHGKGLDSGDYINMLFKGECGKITEGKTRFEVVHENKERDKAKSFEILDDKPPIEENYVENTEEALYSFEP
jgi:replicative DNA helicase